MLKELLNMKKENENLFLSSKILVEDNFNVFIKNGFAFSKKTNKNTIIFLYKKDDKIFKILHKKFFGINFLRAFLNDVSLRKICKYNK